MHGTNRWVFDLARFDEPDPPVEPPADPPADPPVDPPADPDPKPETGDGKDAEIAKWKALSRQNEAKARANADAAKKLAEIEDAQKSDVEKLTAAKEAAEKKAAAAIERAVTAEVKALAGDFADPTDATAAITASDYVTSDGEVDTDAITAKLAELLDAKPHWKKATTPPPVPKPKPDPGQGARPPAPPTDFRTASKEEVDAELAKRGLIPRR